AQVSDELPVVLNFVVVGPGNRHRRSDAGAGLMHQPRLDAAGAIGARVDELDDGKAVRDQVWPRGRDELVKICVLELLIASLAVAILLDGGEIPLRLCERCVQLRYGVWLVLHASS